MKDTATFRRNAVAVGLVGAVITSAIWTLLSPPFPDGYADRLAAIDEAGSSAVVSAIFFPISQLFMLAAVLGIAHLIRDRAPVLSNLGGLIAVIGTLGHAVFGGVALITVSMAADAGNREVYAGLLEDFESSPMMIFAAVGFIGTVLGFVLLSIGLLRSRVVARWIPVLMLVFLVVEFVGASLSDYATYVSGLCLLIAFGALAMHVRQTPRADWAVASAEQGVATSASGDARGATGVAVS